MEQKFERVHFDGEESLAPKLYKRIYSTAAGKQITRYYGLFTDWQGTRRREPLGNNQKRAIREIEKLDKKNEAEVDFDELKARRKTFSQWAVECSSVMKGRDTLNLKHLEPFFGKMQLPKITEKEILGYRAEREGSTAIRHGRPSRKKLSPTTVNKELGLLRKLLRLAHAKGYVRVVPPFHAAKEHGRERVLLADEYKALLDNCGVPCIRRMCIGAYETSLSRSDLLNLTVDEIHETDKRNAQGRKLRVIKLLDGRDKTKVRQEIPIQTPELVALIDELEAEYAKLPNTERLLFTHEGRRIDELFFEYQFRKARKAAKIKNFTFHDLRHTAITRWHVWNLPTAAAMRMAGHSSVQSHKKYVNLDTSDLVEMLTGCLQKQTERAEVAAKSA